ncbi:inverse autotransporter beta domain-containing protein [Xenorhabdus miraniensis]|uniref:Putative invasin n=1 Tax=Xenorhabdus miraniensis TaxID=351674 RepID=A0A2D0JQY7_9GAMM|nr:inverse autotransporter beta domain-containing protein [Xenorhabdus miraniensis]PHM48755.1 putative invasin [Xenorhabdus miraniensis]
MSSYISKFIVFFAFFYTLVMPSAMMHAFAEGNLTADKTYHQAIDRKENIDFRGQKTSKKFLNPNANNEGDFKKNNNDSESDIPNVITDNIQTVSDILSSSPSDLAEQAKSYALDKFNNTITSEAQKWLAQFGTARINFGLDKKGTLENNSLDLLLPLYDNKSDWLLFSQFGYRNKDSRHTLNVGLGGRYFYQNWMYGLNTFYDHDVTGKNQRLGLGGEIWSDYIKLSANTYYRLSDWQQSQHFKDYHERPANGYDISGEFFLPAYPNLGAKLAYEQYFGDNVTLFNRDTKQKNPSLAKLGLTYTPIPLFTVGVDYKQGERNYTETQFLANLNYKLGVPLHAQLLPENVVSMRTLAGSRYDLVERNNNIILDHVKQYKVVLPNSVTGYSHEEQSIAVTNNSGDKIKWKENQELKEFERNGGKLSLNPDNKIALIFPEYQSGTGKGNNYPINFEILENGNPQKIHHAKMTVHVSPFVVKEVEFTPSDGTVSPDGKTPYIFTPVITYDTVSNNPLPPNVFIKNVQWTTVPPIGDTSGLSWGKPDITSTTNKLGQLQAALTSSKPISHVKVFLQMDGMPKAQQVATVSFEGSSSPAYVDHIEVSPSSKVLISNNHQVYEYKALILNSYDQTPVRHQKIANVKWDNDNGSHELKLEGGDTTDGDGYLTATLNMNSVVGAQDVLVTLAIENNAPVSAQRKVSFYPNGSEFRVRDFILFTDLPGPLYADGKSHYTITATITDKQNNPVRNKEIGVKWVVGDRYNRNIEDSNLILQPSRGVFAKQKTDDQGRLTATLSSTEQVDDAVVTLFVGSSSDTVISPIATSTEMDFEKELQDYHIENNSIKVEGTDFNLPADNEKEYTFTAVVVDKNGKYVPHKKITNVVWRTNKEADGLSLRERGTTTNGNGELTATLRSSMPIDNVLVSLAIEGQEPVQINQPVAFKVARISIRQPEPDRYLVVNTPFSYTAIIRDPNGHPAIDKQVSWSFTSSSNGSIKLTAGNTKTNEKGEVTASLISTAEVSDVIVTVSAEGNTLDSRPVQVGWPTVKELVLEQQNGTVSPGGSYHFKTTVLFPDVAHEYWDQNVKFQWMIQSPTGKGLTLSPIGEVTVKQGILRAVLESSKDLPPVKDAVVCLTMIGAPPSLMKCASPVDFVAPSEESLEIKKTLR